MTLVSYFFVCAATAFVCTAVKEDEPEQLAMSTGRLVFFLAGGIALFGVVIQIFTLLAG